MSRYTKKVWTDNQTPMGEVWRDGRRVEKRSYILIYPSPKNQERHLKKAHKWCDSLISILEQQETPDVGGNLFE